MVKIKTKKEMNLPQLIEWGWKNIEKVENKIFKSNTKNVFGRYSTVYFSVDGYGFNTEGVSHKDTFTVETEEEITEDTKLLLIERFIGGLGCANYTSHGEVTINDVLKRNSDDIDSTHFYIENDEREPILIWRDGKLVE